MGYREIPEDKILKFPATPGFKGWETFFIVPGFDSKGIWRRNRAKWRRITAGNEEEFYLSEYGEDVWTRYDPEKIRSLSTNSVSTYYTWKELPALLERFILNKKEVNG